MAVELAVQKLREWREKPQIMVRELFAVTPDPWQDEVLEAFPHKPRIAMCAAKGCGKSTLLAWIGWNYLLTRPYPKCVATSISGDNLRDGLWTEMAKWQQKSKLLQHAFQWTTTRIFAKENPEQWWMSARSYPQNGDAAQQANTLAGLHADYILFLVDESGSMSDAVMVAADAALASCVEGHLIQAGNPTKKSGPLYRAVEDEHRLWWVRTVTGDPDDPKRSSRISLQWARDTIAQHGRENDWVRTNVFGLFPKTSLDALISIDEVRAAMKREYRDFQIGNAAKVFGVDVSRYGDDSSVIFPRQGIQAFKPKVFRGLNGPQGAAVLNREAQAWEPDAVFVDDTGGFGASWIDNYRLLNGDPVGVHFAAAAHDKDRYENKRAEMYFDATQWIKEGGALPPDEDLVADLTNTTYTTKNGVLQIEPKALVKAKQSGRSPDKGDSFVLTFAEPVAPKARSRFVRRPPPQYNPFAEIDRIGENRQQDYRPFKD